MRALLLSSIGLALLACGTTPAFEPGDASPLSFEAAPTEWPATGVGAASAAHAVLLRNQGDVDLGPITVVIEGARDDFDVDATACVGATLAPGDDCAIAIAFHPRDGGARTATVIATAEGAAHASASLTLQGRGLAKGNLVLEPAALEFPRQLIGAASATQIVQVRNKGDAPMPALAIEAGAGFQIVDRTCGDALLGNSTCNLTVAFQPVTGGATAASLTVSSEKIGATAALTGRGFGVVVVDRGGSGGASGTITGGGLDCGAQCRVEIEASSLELTASAPRDAARFVSWKVDGCKKDGPCTIPIRAAETRVEPAFGALVEIEIRRPGSYRPVVSATGECVLSALGFRCLEGSAVRFDAAIPLQGPFLAYRLDRWDGCDRTTDHGCDLVVPATGKVLTVSATTRYTVTANLDQCHADALNCDIVEMQVGNTPLPGDYLQTALARYLRYVDAGATISLLAQDYPDVGGGTVFARWADGPCSGQGTTCTFTVTRAVNVAALFRHK